MKNICLTVDVEDKLFDESLMIESPAGEWPQTIYIAEEFSKRKLKGTFFINVYEFYDSPNRKFLESVVRNLSEMGHEIGLHCHPNRELFWYSQQINQYALKKQEYILRRGRDYLEKISNLKVTVFRAGGYI